MSALASSFAQKVQYLDLGLGVVAAMSLRDPSQPAGYSMRRAGPNAGQAIRNIADFASIIGFDPKCLVMPHRWLHSGEVMIVNEGNVIADPRIGRNPYLPRPDQPECSHSCDGLVTNSDILCLGVQGADCPMLFLYDPSHRVIGAIHCGWKPVAQHIVFTAIRQFAELGSKPADIRAYLSPGAGDREYVFAIDDKSCPLLKEHGRLSDFRGMMFARRGIAGVRVLRLSSLVVSDLMTAGIPHYNIDSDERSCINDPSLHSYRRDGGPDMATSPHGLSLGVIYLS